MTDKQKIIMTSEELKKRITAQDKILQNIAHDIHRMKQFFLWSMIGTVVTFILPLLVAIIVVPIMLSKYVSSFEGLL